MFDNYTEIFCDTLSIKRQLCYYRTLVSGGIKEIWLEAPAAEKRKEMSGNHEKRGKLSALTGQLAKKNVLTGPEEWGSADFARPDNGPSLQALPEHHITLRSHRLLLTVSPPRCLVFFSDQALKSN